MKRIVLVSIAVLALATTVFAQDGRVMLYIDAGFTTCNANAPTGLITVYVVHDMHPGATAIQYSLTENTGGALFYIADQTQLPLNLGDSQTGIATTYGGCFTGAVHVLNVLYQIMSDPPACTGITVSPDPRLIPPAKIQSVDCNQVFKFPNASFLSFNDDGSCQCGEIVPVEATNWGRVKALYQ